MEEMDARAVADVVCPVCGLPIEVVQAFARPSDDREYVTVRCLSEHYVTLHAEDLDALIVGSNATTEFIRAEEEEDEEGLD